MISPKKERLGEWLVFHPKKWLVIRDINFCQVEKLILTHISSSIHMSVEIEN